VGHLLARRYPPSGPDPSRLRDGIKAVAQFRAPPETDWPYDISKFKEDPPPAAFNDAMKDRLISATSTATRALPSFARCLGSRKRFASARA
jgi:hypothetical protein